MALLVLEEFNLGIQLGKNGEMLLQLKGIVGFPEGMDMALRCGSHATEELYNALHEHFHPQPDVPIATPQQAREEMEKHARATGTTGEAA